MASYGEDDLLNCSNDGKPHYYTPQLRQAGYSWYSLVIAT